MSTRQPTYRIGDKVRVLNSRIVRRVGYPLHYRDPDIRDEVISGMCMVDWTQLGFRDMQITSRDAIDGIAKALVRDRRFGGGHRMIHYYRNVPQPTVGSLNDLLEQNRILSTHSFERRDVYDATGKEDHITDRCVRVTGERSAPGGYGEDWEPGCIADAVHHVFYYLEHIGWIERCDIELVEPANPSRLHIVGSPSRI